MKKEGLVYSTENKTDFRKSIDTKESLINKPKPPSNSKNTVIVIKKESKGRGGKIATVLSELPFDKMNAKNHMRALQEKLACGASYKDDQLIFQGDVAGEVAEYFLLLGLKVKRI
ncbi:MAG: translation initiation factor [Oligoflexales bacterium]|nr:translation initiation factor [Oligoflexales bacterium]